MENDTTGIDSAADGVRHSFPGLLEGWRSHAHDTPDASEYIEADFGSEQQVDTVTLWPRDAYPLIGAGFPRAFTIAGSADGKTFKTLYETSDHTNGQAARGPQTFSVAPGSYRYIRVTATKLGASTDTQGTAIFSFELAELEATNTGLTNAGFEGTTNGWTTEGDVSVSSDLHYTGSGAAELRGTDSSIEYTFEGLEPDTTYTVGGYVLGQSAETTAELGVTDFGADPSITTIAAPRWAPVWLTFTTGPDSSEATVHLTNTGAGAVWADEFTLQPERS